MKKLFRRAKQGMQYWKMQRKARRSRELQLMKDDVESRDSIGRTPLMVAAEEGQIRAAKKLIKRGADVNARDSGNWTPLVWANWMGQKRMARLLLRKGADPDVIYQDETTALVCGVDLKKRRLKVLKEQEAGA